MAGPANTQFSVAVHVLTYLAAQPGRPVSSDELAESVNVSPVHVRRVLGPLRRAGIVVSKPGAGGGSELARPAGEIRLDEIWDLARIPPTVAGHGPNPSCPVGRHIGDVLTGLEAEVEAAVRNTLHGRSVEDVSNGAIAALESRQDLSGEQSGLQPRA